MGLPAGPARLKEVIKQLDLTPDQQAKIDGILAAGKGCGKGCGKECGKGCGKRCGKDAPPPRMKEEKALQNAMRDAQRAMKVAQEQMRALQQRKHRAALAKTRREIAAVLTDEQKAKMRRLLGPAGRFDGFIKAVKGLDLSAEQTKKLDGIVAELGPKAGQAGDPAGKGRPHAGAFRKVMALLTDQQKTELRSRHLAGRRSMMRTQLYAGLGLSPQQEQAIGKIMADARQRIAKGVLTDSQREKLRKTWQSRRARGEKARRGGPAGKPWGGGSGTKDP